MKSTFIVAGFIFVAIFSNSAQSSYIYSAVGNDISIVSSTKDNQRVVSFAKMAEAGGEFIEKSYAGARSDYGRNFARSYVCSGESVCFGQMFSISVWSDSFSVDDICGCQVLVDYPLYSIDIHGTINPGFDPNKDLGPGYEVHYLAMVSSYEITAEYFVVMLTGQAPISLFNPDVI